MVKINTSKYSSLSTGVVGGSRDPGLFRGVFVTGEQRDGQEYGKMQCMVGDFKDKNYAINNAAKVNFVPMFIKRFWIKEVDIGNNRTSVVACGYNGEDKIDDQCKFQYVISGMYLDETGKKMMDPLDTDRPLFVYFRCKGMKFGGAMDYTNTISDKSDELAPLTDDPEFERNVVTPRRFITTAQVKWVDSPHGKKSTFEFKLAKKIGDDSVNAFLDMSLKYLEDFDKQFDPSKWIKGGNQDSTVAAPIAGNPTFEDKSQPQAETSASDFSMDDGDGDFNLGL